MAPLSEMRSHDISSHHRQTTKAPLKCWSVAARRRFSWCRAAHENSLPFNEADAGTMTSPRTKNYRRDRANKRRIGPRPLTGDKALENWLRQEVAPAAVAIKADPSRGRSVADVCAYLSADLARCAGPNRRAMMKDEIDAMWGHDS